MKLHLGKWGKYNKYLSSSFSYLFCSTYRQGCVASTTLA
jgi:hypothetical protein